MHVEGCNNVAVVVELNAVAGRGVMREGGGAAGAGLHVAEVALQQEKEGLLLLQRDGAGDDDGGVDVGAHASGDDGENIIGVAGLEVPAAVQSKRARGSGSGSGSGGGRM